MTDRSDRSGTLKDLFANREDLGRNELYRRFFSGQIASEGSLTELFDFLEDEFHISVGLLRPDDDLTLLFHPKPSNWWFGEFMNRAAAGDKRLELANRLHKRLTSRGKSAAWTDIPTFG